MILIRLNDTGFAVTGVDLNGDMGNFIIVCQQFLVMFGRFGIMRDDGNNCRQMMGAHAPDMDVRYPVVRVGLYFGTDFLDGLRIDIAVQQHFAAVDQQAV